MIKRMFCIFSHRLWLPAALVVVFLINWGASLWHTRIDFTNEKRFTLSEPTKKLLKKIDQPVSIQIFLKGNLPTGFKRLSIATDDILRTFKDIAGSKLTYQFVSPEDMVEGTNISYGDTLTSMGLLPINLTSQVKEGQQQQLLYPVGLITYNNQIFPIELYKGKTPLINFQELNSAEAMLEYTFAHALSKLIEKEKPVIGYAVGNGEPTGYNTYDLVENVLKPNYSFFTLDLNAQPAVPPLFNVLLLVKPTERFTDVEKLKIDQYIMQGGKVLLFIDKLNAEMDSLQIKNEVVAYDRELNLEDQLFKYGIRINSNLLMDLQCDYLPFDVNGNGQFELLPWNYFPVLESNPNNVITKNIGYVSGKFVNSIDTIEAEGISKTILLYSSSNARTIATPALISGAENVTAPENEKYQTPHIPVAVLLEGKFSSLFANRLTNAMQDSLAASNQLFLPACTRDNKMIVVSDGDMLLNTLVKGNQPTPMGMNPFTFGTQREFPFANKDFLLNALDFLVDQHGLSEAKSKDYVLRLLDNKKVSAHQLEWQVINIMVPILLVIFFAVVFQWIRKRKYAKH